MGGRQAEAAYEWLERAIVDGALRAGAALPSERVLARELRVSRAAIREAKARLLDRGALMLEAGRLVVVGGSDFELRAPRQGPALACRQLLEGRRCLWVELARLAVRRKSEKSAAALEEATSDLEVGRLLTRDGRHCGELYVQFGRALAVAARNRVLASAAAALQRQLWAQPHLWEAYAQLEDRTTPHQELTTRILAGDRPGAVRVIRKDLARFDQRWLAAFKRGLERVY